MPPALYGPAAQGARRGASRLPPAFVMQIVAPAAAPVLRTLPAATTVIIVKNIHLSLLDPHYHNAAFC